MNAQTSWNEPTLDLSQLEVLAGLQGDGPGDLVGEMIAMFIDEGARRLDDARTALSNGDTTTLRRTAHALRGACGVVGAARLAAMSGTLEADADASREGQADMIAAMSVEFEAVQSQLRPYVANVEKRTA